MQLQRKKVVKRLQKLKRKAFNLALLLFCGTLSSQAQDTLELSLESAISHGLSHNNDLKNKSLDVAYAEKQVKETTAMGLPQVSAGINFQDNLKLPVFVFPNPQTGENAPIRIGNKFTTQASASVNQLLLDGTYFLGLKAAKQFVEMSNLLEAQSEVDVKANIMKAYYLAVISNENIELLAANLNTIEELAIETKKMYEVGFAEKIDADRLQLQVTNLETQLENLNNQTQVALMALKLQMGMDVNTPINLSDNIETMMGSASNPTGDFKVSARPEFKVLEQQITLNELNLKRYKVARLPSLGAMFNYQQANYGETIDYSSSQWLESYYYGVNLQIPLFTGLRTHAKIQQSEIELEKSQNNLENFQNAANLEVYQARQKYLTSRKQTAIQEKNMALALEILNTTKAKYTEGLGSSLEVNQSQTDFQTARTNYMQALYDQLIALVDWKKALGEL